MYNKSQVQVDLIYDVGLHKGEDTAYYLTKGFRVIAFEADPDLSERNKKRFAKEIATGRLIIVEGAIAEGSGKIPFFRSAYSEWGTLNSNWVARNLSLGASNTLVEVDAVDIKSVFAQFGVPHYLKLDIEGSEHFILKSLREQAARPKHISLESEKVSFAKLREELDTLVQLGYRRFKVVPQAYIPGRQATISDINGKKLSYVFENCASGPFGEDLPSRWLSYREACIKYFGIFFLYRLFGDDGLILKIKGGDYLRKAIRKMTGLHSFPGWYDTHATS